MTPVRRIISSLQPMPHRRPPAIVCHEVTKWFGGFCALAGLSLTVEHGEVVVLIGPSGSGKSTLLRCINRLETHSAGDIVIDGIRVSNNTHSIKQVRRQVGMVFQSFNLFPHLTVLANVTITPRLVHDRPKDLADTAAQDLLHRVGMAAHADKYPAQLSGGEQQRVAIARALAMNPRMMLFDEPTSSIDPELTKGIMELIREVASDGMTMLLVTHEIGFARRTADRIAFIDHGELIEQGPPGQLLDTPREERTHRFLEQVPTLWPHSMR